VKKFEINEVSLQSAANSCAGGMNTWSVLVGSFTLLI